MKKMLFFVWVLSVLFITSCSLTNPKSSSEDIKVTTGWELPASPGSMARDPFGPLLDVQYNCGPEERYYTGVSIHSKDDAVNYIQSMDDRLKLYEFKDIKPWMSYEKITKMKPEWEEIRNKMQITKIGDELIYTLKYSPSAECLPDSFEIKVSQNGWMSTYGCCWK